MSLLNVIVTIVITIIIVTMVIIALTIAIFNFIQNTTEIHPFHVHEYVIATFYSIRDL